jgi:hypothetical protein
MTDLQPPTGPTEQDAAAATELDDTRGPVGTFLGDLTSDLGALVRGEVELALAEMKQELMQAAKAGGMLGGGALSGWFALLFASLALAWMLDRKLPRWLAFALVAAIHGSVAAALLQRGREEIEQVDPVPRRTVETLKDDVDVIRGLGT